MSPPPHPQSHSSRALRLKASLLALWLSVSFGACFFARELDFMVAGWPFNYWLGAQGAVLVFIGIVVFYAWSMNRMEAAGEKAQEAGDA